MKKIGNSSFSLAMFLIAISFISCSTTGDDTEIKNIVNKVYQSKSPYQNFNQEKSVFSEELHDAILKAKEVEKRSEESIPESEKGNIKPYMIEGSVFTSLYEGYTSYSIQDIDIENKKCVVKVEFTNDAFGGKEIWADEIVLLNENGWKFDNVVYTGNEGSTKGLKELLNNFIQKAEDNN